MSLELEPQFVPDVDFVPTTYEERKAYVKAHRQIPPALLRQRPRPWLVAPVLYPIIERTSQGRLGWCNATEKTLRIWAYEHTGHVYGERSFSRNLRQAKRKGLIFRKRIPAGAYFKNVRTHRGTTINRFPSEAERRARLAREKHERRRQRREAKARRRAERIIARPQRAPAPALPRDMPHTGLASMREFALLPQGFLEDPRPTRAAYEAEFEALRAVQLEQARELEARWAAEAQSREPPD